MRTTLGAKYCGHNTVACNILCCGPLVFVCYRIAAKGLTTEEVFDHIIDDSTEEKTVKIKNR